MDSRESLFATTLTRVALCELVRSGEFHRGGAYTDPIPDTVFIPLPPQLAFVARVICRAGGTELPDSPGCCCMH